MRTAVLENERAIKGGNIAVPIPRSQLKSPGMSLRANVVIVLHQIRSPDNLGAIARLMANFGFSSLCLSDPTTYAFSAAEKLAIKSEHVLERLVVARSLDEALGDCVYACGTSSRTSIKGREVIGPMLAAERLVAEAERGKVALVFGGEKRGLSDEELALCQDIAAIPTEAVQPSMNLSQSAAVLLFLCARELARPPVSGREGGAEEGARLETVSVLQRHMRGALLSAGFLNPQAPEHILNELVRSLLRGRLSRREAELWLTAFKQLERALAAGGQGES